MKKNNLMNLILLFISELICFFTTIINLIEYDIEKIYVSSIIIVQIFYFIPILFTSFYIFLSPKANKNLLINSTIFLILYSAMLHFFIKQIAILLTDANGVINFVEYAWKIYGICLPLLGIRILLIKKENRQKAYFLIVLRIVLLFIITLVFKNLFGLKGVLYGWSLSEFISILVFFNGKHPSAK